MLRANELETKKQLKKLSEAQAARQNAVQELNELTQRLKSVFVEMFKAVSEVEKSEKFNNTATELLLMRRHLFSIRENYSFIEQQKNASLKKVEQANAVVALAAKDYQALVERNKVIQAKYQQWQDKEQILEDAVLEEENYELFSIQR
jgi:hypothetical protein